MADEGWGDLEEADNLWDCPSPNRVSSTVLLSGGAGPVLPHAAVGEGQGQFSLPSVVVDKGWGRLCVALSSLLLVASGAMKLTTDEGCGRAMDYTTPWPQIAADCHSSLYGLAVAQPSETNIATGGSLDSGSPCGLWVTTQAMDINVDSAGPADPDMAIGRGWDLNIISSWPKLALQITQMGMAPMMVWP